MKKTAYAAAALAAVMISACSGNEKKADAEKTEKKTVKVESESFEPTTNIRYYNMDSVMANYELVKTFNEANLRTMTELQNAQRSREGELNRLAASIQQKMQNNGYLSEASYNADVAELNKKQQAAPELPRFAPAACSGGRPAPAGGVYRLAQQFPCRI